MRAVNECFNNVKEDYFKYLDKEKILGKSKAEKIKSLKKIYIPISFWIENKYKKKGKTLILGFSGGQGSGKTTVAGILKIILKNFFKRKIQVSSIDDFYKTLKDRNEMSYKIHALFKTRGVPGTHDMDLLKKFFYNLKKENLKKFKSPKFDKLTDDRFKKKYWYDIKRKPEIVILEGWCVGAKPQSNVLIKKPINILEKQEDKKFIWRKYVNEKLKREYKSLFAKIDHFIFIKIPNFKMAFKWRLLQEKKLRKKFHLSRKVMNFQEIKRFVMFYQRITLQMIKDLSKSASVVMTMKKNHEITKIVFKS